MKKKLTSSLFAKDEKVSLYGFRITWMTEDGRNIIPENPEFTLDFDLNEAGFPQDAVTSSILKETGGQAAVIIDESTGLTRTDQKLHAEFSTLDLENLYVAAIQSDKEPSDAASVQNQFATSPKNETSEETTLSEKPETIEQTVYCYTVIPGVKVTPDGDCDSEWNGMGIGLVTGAPKAHSVPLNSDVNYLHLPGIHLVKPAELPDLSPNNRYPDSYPPITAVSGKSGETKVYKYAAPNSGNEHTYGYYTIDWDQLVMSDGANAGHNGYNPTVSYYQPTWHLNGVVYLNQEEYVSICFYLKEAGSENWQNISAIRAPTGTTERKIFEDNEVPLMDSEQYPEYKIVNGIGYRLVYWSDEQNMSNPHRLDQDIPITDNTAFYAAYIPEPSKNLKITKQVEGQFADPDQEFEFSMQVHWKNKNWNPAAADIEKYDIQYQDGNYVFKLKAGQTLSLQIPQDAVISVTENLPAHSGYVSEVMRNGRPTDQKNDSFHLTEDTQMLFTNIRQSSEVFFKFRDFDQTEFKLISSVKIPADTTTGMWLENEKLIPSLAQYPQTRILNGQIDHLVFWSENDRLENAKAVSEYGRLQDGQIFYAGYLPVDMHQFSIYKTVSGAGINPDQEFQFEISLSFNGQPFDLNENQLALSKWRKLATGKYSLSLKANEKSLISLPEGVHIHIDEQNAEELGFASNIYVDGQELKNPYDAEIMKDSLVEYHNEKQQWIIDFMFRSAGADKYQLLKSLKVPAATTTEEDLLTQELVPDLASCPEREIKNGTAYHLVYWSENENLQNVTDLKSRKLLRDHEVFYAGYLPEKTQNLKISKSVTGAIMDPDKSFEFNIRILWENIPYELTENQLEKTGWQKTGEGEYRLSLKNGEDTQIDLPYNARISVMESEKSSLGFKTSVFVNDKKNETCSEVILNQDTEIRFINEKLDWKINFFLRNAGETDWQLLKSVKVLAETSTQHTLLDEHFVPDLSAYPEARVVDGIIYHLKFWSDDMDLTSPGSFNNTKPLYMSIEKLPKYQLKSWQLPIGAAA